MTSPSSSTTDEGFLTAICAARTIAEWQAAVTQNGQALFDAARVSLMKVEAGRARMVAASGVAEPARDAAEVLRLESATEAFLRSRGMSELVTGEVGDGRTGTWFAVIPSCPDGAVSVIPANAGIQHATDAQALDSRVRGNDKLAGNDDSVAFDRVTLPSSFVLVVEQFADAAQPVATPHSDFTFRCRFLATQATRSLQQIGGNTAVGGSQPWTRRKRAIVVGLSLLALLAVLSIPVRFELEVRGQLLPLRSTSVFAPEDGIVESLFVLPMASVEPAESLLQLQSAELQLDRQRVAGELETTRARIQAVRAARNTGATTAGGASNLDLSSEQQILDETLASHQRALDLIEARHRSLLVKATVAGLIHQPRLQERLAGRPVRQGQLLLEIIGSDSDCIAELQIPDHLSGYVLIASAADGSVPARVRMAASSDFEAMAEISEIESGQQIVNGQLVCLARAQLHDVPEHLRRPGQGLVARVHCGQRALGFVLFREVIEFFQRKRFAWTPF